MQFKFDNITFDVINLQFFVNYRFLTLLSYLAVYVMLLLKTAFVASDVYTAIKLIVFNKWSSDVQPFISYTICRWLFFGCILLSVVFYVYYFVRGIILYRTNSVALTYIDSTARFFKSVRSYKCFCVYNEISSDNFFSYLAIFTYFTLRDCLVLLLCDTPRQVINGITIFKILKFNSSMIDVIRTIATTNRTEAIILSTMTFSFIVWFVFFVRFLFACLLYFPLRHKINFGLKEYCCVKINQCIQRFMKVKHSKSLELIKLENLLNNINPSVPNIFGDDESFDEKLPMEEASTNSLLLDPFADAAKPALSNKPSVLGGFSQRSNHTLLPQLLLLPYNPFSDTYSYSNTSLPRTATLDQTTESIIMHKTRRVDRQNSDIQLQRPLPLPYPNPFMDLGSRKPSNLSLSSNTTSNVVQHPGSQLAAPRKLIPRSRSNNSEFSRRSSDTEEELSLRIASLNEEFYGGAVSGMDQGHGNYENPFGVEHEQSKRDMIHDLELPPRVTMANNDGSNGSRSSSKSSKRSEWDDSMMEDTASQYF